MSFAAPSRLRLTRHSVCFLLAVLLPPLAAFLTTHISVLQHVSFSTFFLITVLIATFGGLAPSVASAAVAVAITFAVPLSGRPAGFYARDIPRDLLLFSVQYLFAPDFPAFFRAAFSEFGEML